MSPIPASIIPASRSRGSRPASGLCFYGYRYHDNQLGRWLSKYPIQEMLASALDLPTVLDPIQVLVRWHSGENKIHENHEN